MIEYKVAELPEAGIESGLNDLALQNWELVSVVAHTIETQDGEPLFVCFFKRTV